MTVSRGGQHVGQPVAVDIGDGQEHRFGVGASDGVLGPLFAVGDAFGTRVGQPEHAAVLAFAVADQDVQIAVLVHVDGDKRHDPPGLAERTECPRLDVSRILGRQEVAYRSVAAL